ncbi:hypothetical protein UPYG_G00262530 [Umbra pygmaea]|uniref:Golgi apparatus protein 1 n=1 Tax=Umbra pygmaea TaxID=75934 RepID=A0ABD0WA67_UMBPY
MRVAELSSDDFHLDRYLYFSCREDRERFCEKVPAERAESTTVSFNHKFEEAISERCREALTTRQKLIAQDYKVSYSWPRPANRPEEVQLQHGHQHAQSPEARLSYLLLCLESAVHRGRTVSGECQGEMLDYRRMLMEDFSLSPEIVLDCRGEIEAHCSGLHRNGRTLHCLMRVDPWKHGPTWTPSARKLILSCLMEHLYTEKMVEDCEHRLLELQYFIARDWKLDPILYKKCQGDASRLCHTHGWNETNELIPPGAVFSCLYRHAYRTEEQGRRLSRDCKVEVQRILHQRALDVKLDPELQSHCMTDLGKWCSEKTESGQELECLQDHLEDLVSQCRDVVGNLTELESEDIQIETLLMRACEPVIQSHCHEVADNQIDTGDLMECLVQNKHQKEMNDKCAVGVTHFQLVQIKDFRFSYKLKMACKEEVLKLCPNINKKVDVVICLRTTLRNDTLQDAKEQRLSAKCRKQLRVEELEMSEDIRLDPELYDSCKQDIGRLCQNVVFGNAQVIECLRENKRQLSQRCHHRVFKLQEVEMMDPELDYQLIRVCKQMIGAVFPKLLFIEGFIICCSRLPSLFQRFCSEADEKNMLQCLKQNKNSELMDPKCKQMITKRQITQNSDYRLNPVLKKSCKADISKFCQNILNKATEDSELEGQVISCLKLKYVDQRLSPDCEDQIRVILQESALDYRLDPQLQVHCTDEISRLCPEEAAAQEQTGQVEECLKFNLLKIKVEGCKKEVLNILKESKADIFVDPVLHTACALDIKHHCAAIPPGRGRQMTCLMEALQDKRVRLQPELPKMDWDSTNLPEAWRRFKQHAELVFSGPLREKREQDKCSYLLLWIGEKGRDVFNTWSLTEEDAKKLNTYYDKYTAYLTPKSNPIYARYRFHEKMQGDGETFEHFVTELKLLVKDCGYPNSDEMVRDRIVFATNSPRVREKLLSHGAELTLDQAIDIARSHELAQAQLKEMVGGRDLNNDAVHAIGRRPEQRRTHATYKAKSREPATAHRECDRCGGLHTTKDGACPAKGKQCMKCRKLNHFAKACKSKQYTQPNHHTKKVIHTMAENTEEEQGEFYIDELTTENTGKGNEQAYANIEIGTHKVKFKIDTGRKTNAIPVHIFRKLFKENPIKPATQRLTSYGGESLKVKGTCELRCRVQGHLHYT